MTLAADHAVLISRLDDVPPTRASRLPRRPDASAISEAIPLFYIGRNKAGLWVAREADGQRGGFFLTRRGAVRFAKESCEPAGCAMMFVAELLELEFEGHSPATGDAATRIAANDAPLLLTVIDATRKLFAKVARMLARPHRQAIEKDLFGGRNALCSGSGDDFPVTR